MLDPYTEHRFPASSLEEGCRKPVLGVLLDRDPRKLHYGHVSALFTMALRCRTAQLVEGCTLALTGSVNRPLLCLSVNLH